MCGICGAVYVSGTGADAGGVARMAELLAHRGPDDAGLWQGADAALAHRRLSVLDPTPSGHQPWIGGQGRYVLSYNGEVYNFRALRHDLETLGWTFHTQCDTEVLAAALETWDVGALAKLNGMFAFAWYDTQERRLLLARDRLGIKPLFYAESNHGLVFASELDALRRGGLVRATLKPSALDAYLAYLYIPEPDTIYTEVQKLLPGAYLEWREGSLRLERYWQPHYAIDTRWTLDSAAEAYRALLEDAVRLQCVSDVPLGAFLSGGLDSSSVVGQLSRVLDRPVKTFTIGFDDTQADELHYARIAARHFGTDHTEEILRPDLINLLPGLVRHFGEPFADSSALPMWLVARVARAQVTTVLSGDGGDELFAGYSWAHANWFVYRYRRVPGPLRAMAGALFERLPASPRAEKLRRFHGDAALDPHEGFRRRLTCFPAAERARIFRAEFAERLALGPDRFLEVAGGAAGLSEEDWMLYQDTCMYLPGDILAKVDRMTMAHALEARVPLLDHRIVEFAATVPFALKYDGRRSKRVAKHALRGLLPPELLRQRKRGFAIPIDRWFRESLGKHFEEAVLTPTARCGEILNVSALREILDRHRSGKEHYGHRLWAVLVLEHWLREQAAQ